jgi:hypothetical protein
MVLSAFRIYIDHDVMHGATFPVYDFQKFLTHPFAATLLRYVKFLACFVFDPNKKGIPFTHARRLGI